MQPTPELRQRLRKFLNEVIPEGKDETATSFTDFELDELLSQSANIYKAASLGWTIKAGLFQNRLGNVESYSLGQEKDQLTSLKDNLNYALTMAEKYKILGQEDEPSSMVFNVKMPEVL